METRGGGRRWRWRRVDEVTQRRGYVGMEEWREGTRIGRISDDEGQGRMEEVPRGDGEKRNDR